MDEGGSGRGEFAATYLTSIVARLCIDLKQDLDRRKTTYVGPWLPEPIVEPGQVDPGGRSKRPNRCRWPSWSCSKASRPSNAPRTSSAESSTMDTTRSPESSARPSRTAGSSSAAPRSGFASARPRSRPRRRGRAPCRGVPPGLFDRRPRWAGQPAGDGRSPLQRQWRQGDRRARAHPWGGSDRPLLPGNPQEGPDGNLEVRWVRVNGQPGIMAVVAGEVIQALTFDMVDGRIAACFVIRNP